MKDDRLVRSRYASALGRKAASVHLLLLLAASRSSLGQEEAGGDGGADDGGLAKIISWIEK